MLLGSFYKIIESEKDANIYKVRVAFDAAHAIFKGHFPELPVVPGVCQTQMLIETLGHLLQRPVELKLAHHIKFLALLNPEKDKEIEMEIKIEKEADGVMWVSATYSSVAEMFFRFKGELT